MGCHSRELVIVVTWRHYQDERESFWHNCRVDFSRRNFRQGPRSQQSSRRLQELDDGLLFLPLHLLATSHIGYVSRGFYERFYRDSVTNISAWLDETHEG